MLILDETAKRKPPATYAAARINASLDLNFEYDAARRTTVLAASSQEPPLRVVRAFRLEDGSALVHLHNVSGGLLGGDELAMSLEIGENAQAQVTTTGATRIYRSRADAAPAIQRIHVHVGQNACLEYLPDPIIPFAGSRFTQDTKIQLDAGSGLFWWEVLAPGREARDELFAYDAVEMKTSICALDNPIAIERVRLQPRLYPLTSPARLGKYRYWATFYICRVGVQPNAWLALEEQLRERRARTFSGSRRAVGHQHLARPRHCLQMLGYTRTRRSRWAPQTLARREIRAIRHRSNSTAKGKLNLSS